VTRPISSSPSVGNPKQVAFLRLLDLDRSRDRERLTDT
jgi:hypothetical protein